MDKIAETPLETWHFVAFLALLALLGALGHVLRGLINPIPDRLSDSDGMDLVLSDGYNWNDYLFGTEYDDFGYYRLDSWKNFRLAIVWSMIGGAICYLFTGKEMAHVFAWSANSAVEWLWNLTIQRLQGF